MFAYLEFSTKTTKICDFLIRLYFTDDYFMINY